MSAFSGEGEVFTTYVRSSALFFLRLCSSDRLIRQLSLQERFPACNFDQNPQKIERQISAFFLLAGLHTTQYRWNTTKLRTILRGTIVNRNYGTHKCIYIFTYCNPLRSPRWFKWLTSNSTCLRPGFEPQVGRTLTLFAKIVIKKGKNC